MTSIPDWITAGVAVFALLAAVWAGLTSRSLLKVELARNEESALRTERDQASHLAAWTVFCPELQDGEPRDGVFVKNSSPSAVYNVVIESNDREGGRRAPLKMSIAPPGDFLIRSNRTYHWAFPISPAEVGSAIRPITKQVDWQVTSVSFTDAQGTHWRREGALLSRVNDQP